MEASTHVSRCSP